MRSTVAERFWAKVQKTRTCWLWTAARLTDGYGAFKMANGRTYGQQCRAHRVAWMLTHGDITKAVQVLHRCDNPLCVRPTHLFLGSAADNVADKINKGRQRYAVGEASGSARLTVTDVRAIRKAVRHRYQRDVAEEYGVTQPTISEIVNRRTWTHVD